MRKYLFRIVVLIITIGFLRSFSSFSQELSVYNQYYFNPFLLNPAFVGTSGGTKINTVYRQQWLGFADAPVMGTFTVQHATKSNISLGLTVTHEDVVLLQRNAALLTGGYRLPLGYEHFFSFGLSAGIGRYGLDLNQVDRSDPALRNSANSTLYADGNFGFLYQMKNLKLSVAFNNIFDASPYSQDNLNNLSFSNLDSFVGSISYRFQFGNGPVSFLPYVLYRSFGPDFLQAEAAGVFYFQEKVWLGGSYRYQSNPAVFVGFDLFKNFKLSYAYELPPNNFNNVVQGSHELMFSYRFGRKKESKLITEPDEPDQLDSRLALESKVDTANEEVKPDPKIVKSQQKEDSAVYIAEKNLNQDEKVEIYQLPKDTTVVNESIEEEWTDTVLPAKEEINGVPKMKKGYYVVTGVYSSKENAEKFIDQMADQGFLFKMGINPENYFYYVYKTYTDKLLEAKSSRSIYINIKQFSDTWIFEMD